MKIKARNWAINLRKLLIMAKEITLQRFEAGSSRAKVQFLRYK